MNILGQAVKHKKFGKGVVTALSENKITVCFAGKEKLFLFPDAFPQYLVLKNESMQRKIEKLNEERTQKAEAKWKTKNSGEYAAEFSNSFFRLREWGRE